MKTEEMRPVSDRKVEEIAGGMDAAGKISAGDWVMCDRRSGILYNTMDNEEIAYLVTGTGTDGLTVTRYIYFTGEPRARADARCMNQRVFESGVRWIPAPRWADLI